MTDQRGMVGTEVAEVVPTVQEEMEAADGLRAVGAVRAAIVHTTQVRHEKAGNGGSGIAIIQYYIEKSA